MTKKFLKDITPINGYYLIERCPNQEYLPNSIYVPESSRENERWGTILKTSIDYDSDGNLIKPTLKIGDVVYMNKYAGDGESTILLVKENEILGIQIKKGYDENN